jgi:hypothetical protein
MGDTIKAFLGAALVVAFIAMIYGWVMNIVAVLGLTAASPLGEIIVRIVGIFLFPIGGVAGLFF